jgi:hypothetical protein
MKRLMTVVAALTLVAAACGGGDDSTADATADAPTGSTADESTADESTADDATMTEEPSAGPGDDTSDADDDDGDVSGSEIRSISDVPPVCQDAMARFLRALEPIVSPIDWEGATMADFEQIALEFEAKSDEFETAIGDADCDDLNFVDDSEGDILIEFASSEAPGAVGFLEFLDQMRTGTTPGGDGTDTAAIETCQDAIDFLQGLIDDYASIAEVPASELLKIPSIAALYADCTPEQLEFFDSVDLEEFMAG